MDDLPVGVHHLVAAALAGVLRRVVAAAHAFRGRSAYPHELHVQATRNLTTRQHQATAESESCSASSGSYLSLLADDGNCILQLDVMEKALQENVGHPNQVVVFLSLVEWVTDIAVGFGVLRFRKKDRRVEGLKGNTSFVSPFL